MKPDETRHRGLGTLPFLPNCDPVHTLLNQLNLQVLQLNRVSVDGRRKMDDEFCKQRAKAVRELAEKADPFIKKRLLELARHYERRVTRAKETEARPEQQSE